MREFAIGRRRRILRVDDDTAAVIDSLIARGCRLSFRKDYPSLELYVHNLVLPPEEGFEVDHIDGRVLNAQRANLRQATRRQNSQNTSLRSNNASGYKGVSWDKEHGKWYAKIKANGKQRNLGRFTSVLKAAQAYDDAARIYFGEFARFNFPQLNERGVK